jgi:hypothetical protein
MKLTLRNIVFSGITALALISAPTLFAADAKTNAVATAEPEKPKKESYPFHGIIASVDNQAKTITLKKKTGERVLSIDSASKLIVEGKPATLSDVKPEFYAHGSVHKPNGKDEVIIKASFDKEPPAKKGAGAPAPGAADPNAPVKKHKKKPAADGSTNAVPTPAAPAAP